MLEGGIEGRPDNVVFYATSNRRHLMARDMMENERSTAINPGEAVEEKVSLSDRFGLWLGFHRCSQDEYLAMVEGYVAHYRIPVDARHAARARRSNGRPRAARARAASPGNTCRTSPAGSACGWLSRRVGKGARSDLAALARRRAPLPTPSHLKPHAAIMAQTAQRPCARGQRRKAA